MLKDFYRENYYSDNCTMFVAGRVTDRVLKCIEEHFGDTPWGENRKKTNPVMPEPRGAVQKRVTVEKKDGMQSSVKIGCFLPDRMELGLRAGWIQTFQNDRIRDEGYLTPGGFQAEAGFRYYGFGVHNTIYAGSNLMPLYYRTGLSGVTYGADLYTGSLFYSTDSGLYDRLEISYCYDFRDFLSLRVASVHHFDGYGWGWQQIVQLKVNLNNFQFPLRGHRPQRHRR